MMTTTKKRTTEILLEKQSIKCVLQHFRPYTAKPQMKFDGPNSSTPICPQGIMGSAEQQQRLGTKVDGTTSSLSDGSVQTSMAHGIVVGGKQIGLMPKTERAYHKIDQEFDTLLSRHIAAAKNQDHSNRLAYYSNPLLAAPNTLQQSSHFGHHFIQHQFVPQSAQQRNPHTQMGNALDFGPSSLQHYNLSVGASHMPSQAQPQVSRS